jgi:phosphate:Na+ symporter
MFINIFGGVGLILLGMKLMSDGLKKVAGGALRTLLAKWTHTPLRGVATGFVLTSAVQSLSAVTIATIGFVNAGLMTLGQVI